MVLVFLLVTLNIEEVLLPTLLWATLFGLGYITARDRARRRNSASTIVVIMAWAICPVAAFFAVNDAFGGERDRVSLGEIASIVAAAAAAVVFAVASWWIIIWEGGPRYQRPRKVLVPLYSVLSIPTLLGGFAIVGAGPAIGLFDIPEFFLVGILSILAWSCVGLVLAILTVACLLWPFEHPAPVPLQPVQPPPSYRRFSG